MRTQILKLLRTIWLFVFEGVPRWLFLPGALRQWTKVVHADALPLEHEGFQNGEIIDLTLGPKLFLRKDLSLPVAARSNLARVIDLNMRQSLPGGGADLIWRYSVEKRDKSNLKVNVFLLKKRVLSEILDASITQKTTLRTIQIADHPLVPPFWENQKKIDRPLRNWGMIAVALFASIIGVIGWQEAKDESSLKQRLTQLEGEKADLSQKAVELRARLDVEDSSFAAISRDVDIFKAEFQRLPVLISLTETLTDETWISELAINGANLHLSGFTGNDITDVMTAVRDLPWAQRVDLDGPVSFDSFSRRNRFDFSSSMQNINGASR